METWLQSRDKRREAEGAAVSGWRAILSCWVLLCWLLSRNGNMVVVEGQKKTSRECGRSGLASHAVHRDRRWFENIKPIFSSYTLAVCAFHESAWQWPNSWIISRQLQSRFNPAPATSIHDTKSTTHWNNIFLKKNNSRCFQKRFEWNSKSVWSLAGSHNIHVY